MEPTFIGMVLLVGITVGVALLGAAQAWYWSKPVHMPQDGPWEFDAQPIEEMTQPVRPRGQAHGTREDVP